MELWVPGRIELLGKHTDYAGGRSLRCAVERGIRATARPRTDSIVRVHDSRLDVTVGCILDAEIDLSAARGRWALYVETVARRIARDFPNATTGVDISFESDLPIAAGLSSSSALVVMLYMAIAAANDLPNDPSYRENIRSPEDLAEYVGSIENGAPFRAFAGDAGVGTLNGCEDQTAALNRSDLASLGDLVDRSQAGVERLLGNQIPETIALARLARDLGAVAASAFGAGFGGSVWALVQRTDADAFVEAWRREYSSRFPQHREQSAFFVTRAGPPATLSV